MALFRKQEESALTRRIREIERERKTIERDLRLLNKAIKKPGTYQDPRRPAGGQELTEAEPAPARQETAAAPSADELFPDAQRPQTPGGSSLRSRPGATPSDPEPNLAERERSKLEGDHRFANYIVAGNVDGIRPLRHERSVQRNRAILMIVVVLIVLVWVVYSCSAMRDRSATGDLPPTSSINDSPLP